MAKSLKNYGLKITSVYPRHQLEADLKRYAVFMLATSVMLSSFIIRKNEDATKFKESMQNSTMASITEDPEKAIQAMLVTDNDTVLIYKSRIEGLIDSYLEFGLLEE